MGRIGAMKVHVHGGIHYNSGLQPEIFMSIYLGRCPRLLNLRALPLELVLRAKPWFIKA